MNVDLDTNLEEVLPSNISPFFFHYPNIFGFVAKFITRWWLNHPSEKYARQIIFPQGLGWKFQNIFETTTQSSYKLLNPKA